MLVGVRVELDLPDEVDHAILELLQLLRRRQVRLEGRRGLDSGKSVGVLGLPGRPGWIVDSVHFPLHLFVRFSPACDHFFKIHFVLWDGYVLKAIPQLDLLHDCSLEAR